MSEFFRFAAFISYSSKDAAFAKKLHRALEVFKVPSELGTFDLLGGGKKNRAYPIFRDREELPSGELGEQIEAALKASSALIIVCSPNSAASPWVNKEIETFLSLGRRDRIFAIIADTVPLSDANGADATKSSFPPAFRPDALSDKGVGLEPIAADARKGKDGFSMAVTKVVAGLFGLDVGKLRDREKARNLSRALTVAGASFVSMAALIAGYTFVDQSYTASLMTNEAERLLREGRYLEALPVAISAGGPFNTILPSAGAPNTLAPALSTPIAKDFGATEASFSRDRRSVFLTTDNSIRRVSIFESAPEEIFFEADPGDRFSLLESESHILKVDANGVASMLRHQSSKAGGDSGSWSVLSRIGNVGRFGGLVAQSASGDAVISSRSDAAQRSFRAVLIRAAGEAIPFNAPIRGAVLSNSGNYFVAGDDYGADFCDLREQRCVPLPPAELGDPITSMIRWGASVQFSAEDRVWALSALTANPLVPGSRNQMSVFRLSDGSGTRLPEVDLLARWKLSPDGNWIALWEPDQGASGRLILRSTSRNIPDQVLGETDQYEQPEFSADSSAIAFITRAGTVNIRVVNQGAENRSIIELDTAGTDVSRYGRWGMLPQQLTDGRRVLWTVAQDGWLRAHRVDAKDVETTIIARLSNKASVDWGDQGKSLLIREGSSGSWLFDLQSRDAETQPGNWRERLCSSSADNIRPISDLLRSQSDTPAARSSLRSRIEGRPWHPCDWRGLGTAEGWAQFIRMIQVRYFGGQDYVCEEIDASGATSPTSRARCEKMRSTRSELNEQGLN